MTSAVKPADTRTEAQRQALRRLLKELKERYPRALIVGHHDLNPLKACPCFDAVGVSRLTAIKNGRPENSEGRCSARDVRHLPVFSLDDTVFLSPNFLLS